MKVIFGVDVGGTNIKFGKFKLDNSNFENSLLEKFMVKTLVDENPDVLIGQIYDEIYAHLGDDELVGLGVGIPGPVMNGVVLGAQNIKWEIVNLKELLDKKFPNLLIKILNDANAATLGEWYFGYNHKKSNAILITLGTGVGGGIILNGHLVEGSTGSAGEIGHIKIYPFNGRECSCGLTGCLEQYASATGIVKTARSLMKHKMTTLSKIKFLSAKSIFDEAKAGDEVAKEVAERTAYYLSVGLASICNTINPDVVIIGGGVSRAGDYFLEKVRAYFEDLAFFSVKNTEIVLATLLNDAGIYGNYINVIQNLND